MEDTSTTELGTTGGGGGRGGGGVGGEASLPVCKGIKLVNYSETLITAWFYDTVVALY